jgi:hypothetical protein
LPLQRTVSRARWPLPFPEEAAALLRLLASQRLVPARRCALLVPRSLYVLRLTCARAVDPEVSPTSESPFNLLKGSSAPRLCSSSELTKHARALTFRESGGVHAPDVRFPIKGCCTSRLGTAIRSPDGTSLEVSRPYSAVSRANPLHDRSGPIARALQSAAGLPHLPPFRLQGFSPS